MFQGRERERRGTWPNRIISTEIFKALQKLIHGGLCLLKTVDSKTLKESSRKCSWQIILCRRHWGHLRFARRHRGLLITKRALATEKGVQHAATELRIRKRNNARIEIAISFHLRLHSAGILSHG